ncbi:MAG: hypothetical protein JWL79_3427 [Frankiales bacterium]|nr:hypothetical protein [Frankiales bacterium]
MRAGRVAGRSGVAVVIALLPVVGLAGPAHADTSAPAVTKTAWYWAEKTTVTPVAALPTLPDQANAASGVPDGDLGVGYVADTLAARDKLAALDIDLTAIPVGALFSSFQLTVPVDTAANNVQSGTADISACENIDVFSDSGAPQAITKAPPYAAPTCVKGVLNAAKAYVFDLTAMANEWSQGTPAQGISIVPTLLPTADMRPFSISLKGKNAITTKATWSPPVTQDPGTTAPPPVAPTVPSAVAPPPIMGGGTLPAVPDVQVPAPQAVPQPQSAPVPQAVAIRPASFAPRSLVPSTQWWFAVLAVAGVLGLAWLTQSDPLVPAPADPRRARFARAVRSA